MSKWQPIETIPKDGTQVIVKHKVFGAIEANWNQQVYDECVSSFRRPFCIDSPAKGDWLYPEDILYWMPLPEPPEEEND